MINILASDINLWISTVLPSKKSIHILDPANKLILDEPMKDMLCADESPQVLLIISTKGTKEKDLKDDDFDVVIDFSNQIRRNDFSSIKLSYVNRRDGSIKWIFKKGTLNFSNLFQQVSSKDKSRMSRMRFLRALRCDRFFTDGYFTVLWKKSISGVQYTRHLVDSYAYSSGAKEYGGSPTVFYRLGSEPCYVKFCRNGYSKSLLQNQLIMIGMWKGSNFESVIMPRIDKYSNTSNISIGNYPIVYSENFTHEHAEYIKEIIDKTIRQYKFFETPQFLAIKHNIELLRAYKSDNIPYFKYFSDVLTELKLELSNSRTLFSYGYGDFTPWSSTIVDQKVYLFNFSYATSMHPILFDFFHFIFHNEGIVKNKDWNEVKQEIQTQLVDSGLIELIDKWAIDVEFYLKHYLLNTVSQNLGLLAFQEEVTKDQLKLIDLWKEALVELTERTTDERKGIHSDLAHYLNRCSHTFLQVFENESEEQGPSEIEVLIRQDNQGGVIRFLENHPYVSELRVVKKMHGTQVFLRMIEGQFMLVILRNKFMTNGIKYIDSNLVLNTSRKLNGILVPDSRVAVECQLLASAISSQVVTDTFIRHIRSATRAEQEIIQNYLNKKYDLGIQSIGELCSIGRMELLQIRNNVRRRMGIVKWGVLKFSFALTTIVRGKLSRGFECTFSEIPNTEKSDIIKTLQIRLKARYNKDVVILSHRPGLISLLFKRKRDQNNEKGHGHVSIPRRNKADSFFVSLSRFGFYYIDYLIGQLYVKLKYTWRDKIVIYDSYYFNFLNDTAELKNSLKERALKRFYHSMVKPQLGLAVSTPVTMDSTSVYEHANLEEEYAVLFNEFAKYKKPGNRVSMENLNSEQIIQKIMKVLPIIV